jgi:RNA polymerase sigma factor for flagellar operon FliA
MLPEQEALFMRFLPLVQAEAGKLARKHRSLSFEDIFQDGCIALIEAIQRADPDRMASFAGFAKRRVYGAMVDGIRRTCLAWQSARRAKIHCRSCERASTLDRCEACPHLQHTVPLEVLELKRIEPELRVISGGRDVFALSRLQDALRALRPIERRVIVLHYINDLDLAEVAATVHRSPAYLWQLHRKALQELRTRLTRRPSAGRAAVAA